MARGGTEAEGGMAFLNNTSTYRQREAQWREQALMLPAGREREACLALAEGYANLVEILERLDAPEAAEQSSV